MKIQTFEDLTIWQHSHLLAAEIYRNTSFDKDHDFRRQLRRAVVSVSNNIAEGFGRPSKKDFARYLIIARGSLMEVRSMMLLSYELEYTSKDDLDKFNSKAKELEKMIWGLHRHLNK